MGDAVVDGAKGMAVDTAGQYAAHQIGQAYRGKTPETATKSPGNKTIGQTGQPQVPDVPKMDYITHKEEPLRDVQQLAGHTSLQMTQSYIDGDAEARRKVVELI
jgi:hypothetical protein